jgi:CRISPR-associated protein Csd2
METLKNKIDFAVIFSVKGANPNGDPLNGNRPRTNYDGLGELSDVCIKRKIRNRLMEAGKAIFVQSDDNKVDDYRSLRSRAEGELIAEMKDEKKFREEACKKWIDVRAFGQVFAYKGDGGGVSIGIRGPVSIHPAFSVAPVSVSSIQITKSVSGEADGAKKASDTMGMKHRVDHGLYVSYGAINPQLASKTWFEDGDAKAIKNALEHLFDNDASSARPEGSMEVVAVFWWQHNVKHGQYSSAVVHRSLSVEPKEGVNDPRRIEDYSIKLKNLDGLTPEIFNPNNVVIDRV